MTANAFEFMRSFIHFANDNERAPRNHPNYDPLHKVRHMLNTIMDGIRKVWSAGMNITIDESMIRYSGRAVSWVQYMPAKPFKPSKSLLHVVHTLVYFWRMTYTVAKTLMAGT
jgi:hypothetical protein